MRQAVRTLVLLLAVATAGTAFAQPQGDPRGRRHDGGSGRLSGEERQRLREDVQRQHSGPQRDPGGEERARRYAEWQRLSPEQREGIRRDMRNANRDYERRR
jgi:Ni/Co efflux regulator RcnB